MMKSFTLKAICFALLTLFGLAAHAQRTTAPSRRTPTQMRAALAGAIGSVRAESLQPVIEHDAVSVLSSEQGGFAVVNHSTHFPAVLAYGDQPIDPDNPSPEFLYLMSLYEDAIAAAEETENAPETTESASDQPQFEAPSRYAASSAPARIGVNTNIGPLVTTKWNQGTGYNDLCPLYNGGNQRCQTGCVATATAQVINYFHSRFGLPTAMRGKKTYNYENSAGNRVSHSFDFAHAAIDWSNMPTTISKNVLGTITTSSTQRDAVSKLMYACGVMSSMNYGTSVSAAYAGDTAEGISGICEGLEAIYTQYETSLVMEHLSAERPVIYCGQRSNESSGHCFVIDGCRSDGYFHCNLGWGGSGDGYYLPTDMNGYVNYQYIVTVFPYDRPDCTPMLELKNRIAVAADEGATTLEPNRWYALWSNGREGSPYVRANARNTLYSESTVPSGETTNRCASQLMRLIPADEGGYYIQTGVGNYLGRYYLQGTAAPCTDEPTYRFNIEEVQPGYFALQTIGGYYVGSNGPGNSVAAVPSRTSNIYNSTSWVFYPVTVGYDPSAGLPDFDAEALYTLKNVGYSQGYLVATSASDANPTLRGVTQDHANGLFSGAAYHDAMDSYNLGSYWHILTEGGQHYLQNVATNKYLTNTGDKTCYVFTNEKKPINITLNAGGSFCFNTGTDAQSYLCAATHLENPAAFWTADDAGSLWMIEEAVMPKRLESVSFSRESLRIFRYDNVQLAPDFTPADTRETNLVWTSLDPTVASVDSEGNVNGLSVGETTIVATSASNPSISASVRLIVVGARAVSTVEGLAAAGVVTLRNTSANGYCRGYLVGIAEDDAHPTLRAIETQHANGCADQHYYDPLDLDSPYAYWQILTDGSSLYLYNLGLEKFITNSGVQSQYIFIEEPRPVSITLSSSGKFLITASEESKSYLCAATHLDNPAAFWTADDAGSEWTVASVEGVPAEATDYQSAITYSVGRLTRTIAKLPTGAATLRRVETLLQKILCTE